MPRAALVHCLQCWLSKGRGEARGRKLACSVLVLGTITCSGCPGEIKGLTTVTEEALFGGNFLGKSGERVCARTHVQFWGLCVCGEVSVGVCVLVQVCDTERERE